MSRASHKQSTSSPHSPNPPKAVLENKPSRPLGECESICLEEKDMEACRKSNEDYMITLFSPFS